MERGSRSTVASVGATRAIRSRNACIAWLSPSSRSPSAIEAGACSSCAASAIAFAIARRTSSRSKGFDDSRPHEVWNDTDEERVVLLLDVRRPMRWPGRWLYAVLSAALRRTHFVRESVDAQLAWERAIADRFRPAAVTSHPSARRSLEGAR